jgi:hypothetical protein
VTVPLRHHNDLRGHRLPATLDAIALRNSLLAEAARRFYAGMSDRAAAAMLHTKLGRYLQGDWRRDAAEDLCPARYRGTVTEVCWMILKVHAHAPSISTIRRALGFS